VLLALQETEQLQAFADSRRSRPSASTGIRMSTLIGCGVGPG
jgi:hypothetical protein